MITIKENTLERIKNWTTDSIHILADFDKTITSGDSISSWGIIDNNPLIPKEYIKEKKELYNYYRPIELDENISFEEKNQHMIDWWVKHINLLVKYKLSEELINESTKNQKTMFFRNGAKEFLKTLKEKNIPVIIMSAGIGNFIEQFLIKNDCYYENIYIISNFIKFENGYARGMTQNIIHSLNKNEIALPEEIKVKIEKRPNIILLGDTSTDVEMAKYEIRNSALKIGFLEENIEENRPYYEDLFDIVCTNTDFFDLLDILPILQNK